MIDRDLDIKKFGNKNKKGYWIPLKSEHRQRCCDCDSEIAEIIKHNNVKEKSDRRDIENGVRKNHCKSYEHVANLYEVDVKELVSLKFEIIKIYPYEPSDQISAIFKINTRFKEFTVRYLTEKQNAEDALNLIKSDSSVKREVKSL